MNAPVRIHRSPIKVWHVSHNGEDIAFFGSGQRALAYVDNELRAWEHQQRSKPVNWAPLIAAIAKGITNYAKKDTA